MGGAGVPGAVPPKENPPAGAGALVAGVEVAEAPNENPAVAVVAGAGAGDPNWKPPADGAGVLAASAAGALVSAEAPKEKPPAAVDGVLVSAEAPKEKPPVAVGAGAVLVVDVPGAGDPKLNPPVPDAGALASAAGAAVGVAAVPPNESPPVAGAGALDPNENAPVVAFESAAAPRLKPPPAGFVSVEGVEEDAPPPQENPPVAGADAADASVPCPTELAPKDGAAGDENERLPAGATGAGVAPKENPPLLLPVVLLLVPVVVPAAGAGLPKLKAVGPVVVAGAGAEAVAAPVPPKEKPPPLGAAAGVPPNVKDMVGSFTVLRDGTKGDDR